MPAPTRWGICGAGKISHDFTTVLHSMSADEHQVVAVAARDVGKAKSFAQLHGIPKAFGSYEELAQDSDIDVVYIGVIHPKHLSVGLQMLAGNKPVLCEKPFTMNACETQELINAAQSRGLFLMEAMWTRFFPVYQEVRTALKRDEMQDIRLVRAEFGANVTNVPRCIQKELGGGAVLDIGIYCLQFISMVYNGEKPEEIHSTGTLCDTGVDETVTVILKYSGNRLGIFTCSLLMPLSNEGFIFSPQGHIKIPAPLWCPTKIETSWGNMEFPLPPISATTNFTNGSGMCYEADEVRRCLLKGFKESPIMPLAESELLSSIMKKVLMQLGVSYESPSKASSV
uniref:Trans-1,2-dihydrobenzene-1,2-diol dehydrogenase n=1 Tax=Eptatretus burgeri TaxID=7764 RepID=A0A8C4NIM1_EPTBU